MQVPGIVNDSSKSAYHQGLPTLMEEEWATARFTGFSRGLHEKKMP